MAEARPPKHQFEAHERHKHFLSFPDISPTLNAVPMPEHAAWRVAEEAVAVPKAIQPPTHHAVPL